jgi:hypothetical protein
MRLFKPFIFLLLTPSLLLAAERKPGSPLDHPPSNLKQLTYFGERADFSPDNQRVAFMAKSFGDAFVVELKTRIIRCLTCNVPGAAFLRVMHLSNGDYILIGRPNPSYGNISQYDALGDAWFHGLTLSLEARRLAWGGARVSYTLSRARDDAGNAFFQTPQTQDDILADTGPSDNDQRHRLVFSGTVGDGSSPAVRRALAGLQFGWVYSFGTPLPFNVEGLDRPVLAVGPHLKNTVALSVGSNVFVSQHVGDLETAEACRAFERVVDALETLYETRPSVIACDAHPNYLSTAYARRTGLPLVEGSTTSPTCWRAWPRTRFARPRWGWRGMERATASTAPRGAASSSWCGRKASSASPRCASFRCRAGTGRLASRGAAPTDCCTSSGPMEATPPRRPEDVR